MVNPNPTSNAALVMTSKEVAAALKISLRTLYRLLDGERIPKPIKLGNLIRFRRSDIELFLEEGSMSAYRKAKRSKQS